MRPIAPPVGRRQRLAFAIALVLLAGLVLLWSLRKPIAQHFIDRELARRGVPARYRIADLGFGRQRLSDLVIGNPAAPDLTADWVETDTAVGFGGARLVGVRAGNVHLRGRWANGRVSLGFLDRLAPAPAGKPFALPAISLDVSRARVDLATPAGPVVAVVTGRGRLDGGFAGRVAADAARLALGGCRVEGAHLAAAVHLRDGGAPVLAGQATAARIPCGSSNFQRAATGFEVALSAALDRWQGQLHRAGVRDARFEGVHLTDVVADLSGTGTAQNGSGTIRGTTGSARWPAYGTGRAGTFSGSFAVSPAGRTLDLNARLDGASLDQGLRQAIIGAGAVAPGTPLAPLARSLTAAAARAAAEWTAAARLTVRQARAGTALRLFDATLRAASGARLALAGPVTWRTEGDAPLAATITSQGGGLPAMTVALRRAGPGAPVTGRAALQRPYAAGGATLGLAPIAFSVRPDGTAAALRTTASLSGPLGDGRIEGLVVPIDARWADARLTLGRTCTPVSITRLALAGLTLDPARLTLCARGEALVAWRAGVLTGGGSLGAVRLAGLLGTTPVTVGAANGAFALETRGFSLAGVEARLGTGDQPTRLAVGRLGGTIANGALAGRFEGAGGHIGAVPLNLSQASGVWRLADGRLALDGTLGVSDTAAAPRFQPLRAESVTLLLANGTIAARGALVEPTRNVRVGAVTLDHRLASGQGAAVIAVPGITFTEAFQPNLLTPLTFGVIADVRGTVTGDARIAWSPAGVTSTGTFRTPGTDLAAAFGPVTGLATEIRFTDLLNLRSAPGQVATVTSINPGIPVGDGVIRYQILPDTRVRVEGARWPFAGGTLTLEPTLLDFAEKAERRMTFRVEGMAADRFLQQFDFKNLDATGTFDGVLPMVFDASGGRVEGGALRVRPGGGSLAYLGELSQKDLGFWGNFAFGALRSLRYRSLDIAMNGPLAGEMITDVRFAGVTQGEGATSNFLIRRLQRLPIVFNIRIRAPFRGLLTSAQDFYDPSRLVRRHLPELMQGQDPAPVQPPASENMP